MIGPDDDLVEYRATGQPNGEVRYIYPNTESFEDQRKRYLAQQAAHQAAMAQARAAQGQPMGPSFGDAARSSVEWVKELLARLGGK